MSSRLRALLESRRVVLSFLAVLCLDVCAIGGDAASTAAGAAPCQRRWGLSIAHCFARSDVSVLVLQAVRGGSDYESPFDKDGDDDDDDDDDDENLPPIDEQDDEEEWLDGESSKETDVRGGDFKVDVHGSTEGEEAITEAWENEEEEEEDDFVDANEEDIQIELTEQVDDFSAPPVGAAIVEPETSLSSEEQDEAASSFTAEAVLDNPAIDDNDSSTYVDRMDLADAYDEDVALDTDANIDAGDSTVLPPFSESAATMTTESIAITNMESSTSATSTSDTSSSPVTAEIDDDTMPPISESAAMMTTESSATNMESDTTATSTSDISDIESQVATSSSSSATAEIDDDTRKVLLQELKYRKAEVDAMRPGVAVVVAANKLHRPEEGIPGNWRRLPTVAKIATGVNPWSMHRDRIMQILPKIVVPVVVGALAIAKGPEFVTAMTTSKRSSVPKYTSPATTAAATVEATTPIGSTTKTTTPTSMVASSSGGTLQGEALGTQSAGTPPPLLLKPVNEHTSALGEKHPHSVKPGKAPVDESDLDVTWLDKLITYVERQLKAFLRIEI